MTNLSTNGVNSRTDSFTVGELRLLEATKQLAESCGLELAVDTTYNTCIFYCTSVVGVVGVMYTYLNVAILTCLISAPLPTRKAREGHGGLPSHECPPQRLD